ncbi:ribosome biogenesis factor YjgA [Agitococcus lubricus]|uniref:Dual-action ribosomal maturation protein DarP n=1 Tax=Agitococcus lubricus TaxID=1077255 RepID=A0A2T5IZG5_9GAMM|nr:ribosome biogenesis factor YjgA [Agitococcus lubricus]PTQ89433.1 ribosome-associated protein [Agitococcus lubricus]
MRNSAQEHDYDPNFVSKSEQKRAMERLQAIGEQLAELPAGQLKKLPISEELRDALLFLPTLKSNEAKRRHKQLIGKLMRHEDEDALLQALNQRKQPNLERQLSLWVDRLISQGESALQEALRQFPAAERHPLRQALRAALYEKEHTPEESKAKLRLFTYLREAVLLSQG